MFINYGRSHMYLGLDVLCMSILILVAGAFVGIEGVGVWVWRVWGVWGVWGCVRVEGVCGCVWVCVGVGVRAC